MIAPDWWSWGCYVFGFITGGAAGFIICALLTLGGWADERTEKRGDDEKD